MHFLKEKIIIFFNKNSKAKEIDGVKIIRYEESIYYANVDNFKYKLIKLSQIDPIVTLNDIHNKSKKRLNENKKKLKVESATQAARGNDSNENLESDRNDKVGIFF